MKEGGLYSSYIANCVFNALLSLTAVVLNSVTIHAIKKTSSLRKPLKTLLWSLTVSDVGVGLLAQPLFVAVLVMESQRNAESNPSYNATSIAFLLAGNSFFFASFFGVMALSLDRFLAIHLHLRYQELVTQRRVVVGVISIWVFSAFLSLLRLWIGPGGIIFGIYSFIEIFCVVTAACLNYKIFVAVRRHAHQIQALQVQQVAQNEEVANFGRMRKSAVATVFVYVVFLVCYLPNICGLWIGTMAPEFLLTSVARYLLTLLFLNSSLNPLIYCWKMRDIRHNIVNTLRDAFSC